MLNCPECGLKITDAQQECPKCHTKIEDIKEELEKEEKAESAQKETEQVKPTKRKRGRPRKTEVALAETSEEMMNTDDNKSVKEEMIKAVVEAEEEAAAEAVQEEESAKIEEEMIAAAVEAEALAVIEEEEAAAAAEEENFCETCMAPVDKGQNLCHLCATSEPITPVVPKSDAEANKWIAAIGYVIFFFPALFGFHRKSKFVKFHAKQATALFIASTVLFLALVIFRDILDDLFTLSPMPNLSEIFTMNDTTAWRHGTGVLFQYYLVGMIYALHLMPFALMIIGFIHSVQGEKKPLPFVGRFIKTEKTTN